MKGTRAAIYARYSTDKQRDSSIDDQYRNAESWALRNGLTVVARFKDEAQSGMSNQRAGYRDMLAAAEAKQFDVLIVDDLSRLTRDDIELGTAVRRFAFQGLRLVGASDGFDSITKTAKIQRFARGMINEIFLDDLREKTHRGLYGKALNGFNAGGRCYGYEHKPLLDTSGKHEYGRAAVTAVERELHPDQAPVVLQIFEWYADGHPPRWIASELNRRGVPSLRGGTWSASAIVCMLDNELYVGRYHWNRSTWLKHPDDGKRKRVARPASEWVTRDMPHLRIVPDGVWQRVKERQTEQRGKSDAIRAALHKNARTGAGPKFLFSGLLTCSVCGARFVIADAYRYGCANHINRGPTVCSNALRVPRKLVEERLLQGIKQDLFTPEGIEFFKSETTRLLAAHRTKATDRTQLLKQLDHLERQIANIVAVIKDGKCGPTLMAELARGEAEKTRLQTAVAGADTAIDHIAQELPRAVDRFRELVADLATVTQRDVARARASIRALVGGEIRLLPTPEGHLVAELRGDYAGLVSLAKFSPGSRKAGAKLSLVAGTGFEPVTFRL